MQVEANSGQMLTEYESKKILAENGIPTTKFILAKTETESITAAKNIGYPVVMKVMSRDIVHKTEAGGVKIGLSTPDDVGRAFAEIMKAAKAYNPKARIDGACVQESISDGVESIIGAKRDPTFGPVVIFGLGGIFVELVNDVSMRVVPFTELDAREMITELKAYKILEGYRTGRKADTYALANMIMKVGKLMAGNDAIIEMDLNPVMVREKGKGAVALDARILSR
jgi:acyl-CoA synthetase (NDP forming)